jgi:hypothetical protein
MAGSGPTTAGAGGGSSTAGSGMGGAGGAGKCPANQTMKDGRCACPGYAATWCEAIPKCVNPMKEPDTCGNCTTTCKDTQACVAGTCAPELVMFGEVAGCGSLALQSVPGKAIYVLATMTGAISSIPAAGGAATPIATVAGATAFALDDTAIYVAAGMKVVRVPLTGGASTELVTEAKKIYDVAVSNGKIYYATDKFIKGASASAAGPATTVATSIDEGEAQGVAVSGTTLLYASNIAYNLESDPIAGDGHTKIGASQSALIFGHRSVQADATSVYWANTALNKAPIAGAEHPITAAAAPIDGKAVIAFAVDGRPGKETAYIATEDGNLAKSTFTDAEAGTEATWMARKLPQVTSIVLDDTSVFAAAACKILKAPR